MSSQLERRKQRLKGNLALPLTRHYEKRSEAKQSPKKGLLRFARNDNETLFSLHQKSQLVVDSIKGTVVDFNKERK